MLFKLIDRLTLEDNHAQMGVRSKPQTFSFPPFMELIFEKHSNVLHVVSFHVPLSW